VGLPFCCNQQGESLSCCWLRSAMQSLMRSSVRFSSRSLPEGMLSVELFQFGAQFLIAEGIACTEIQIACLVETCAHSRARYLGIRQHEQMVTGAQCKS